MQSLSTTRFLRQNRTFLVAGFFVALSILAVAPRQAFASCASANDCSGQDGTSEGPRDGENGGNVTITVDSPTDSVSATSNGGRGANVETGEAGDGGNGGTISITINAPVTDVNATAVAGLYGFSEGGEKGTSGSGGNITINVNSSVEESISANAGSANKVYFGGPGSATINLNNGASVGGTISGDRAGAQTVLSFNMDGTQTDYDALEAVLGQRDGTVTIGDRVFTWASIDELVNNLRLFAAENPNTPIVINVAQETGQPNQAPSGPTQVCESKVKVFRTAEGNLEVYAGFDIQPNGFLVAIIFPDGTINPVSLPVEGWTAQFANGLVSVFDNGSNLVDNCNVTQ
jgi:hypothetical protein